MNQLINSEYDCKDCKFYDGKCKVYGLNTPRVYEDFVISECETLRSDENDYI